MPLKLPEWLRLVKGQIETDDDEPVDLLLSEPIGFDPETYTGMSAREFGMVLNSIPKNKKTRLLINTMGGSVPEGTAMTNMCLARGNVTTCVIGYAASMGAMLLQGGSKRQMMPGTLLVIHNPQTNLDGDAAALDSAKKHLETIKKNIVETLSQRTGTAKRTISDMMDATTSMDPKTALELGFIDEIVDGSPAYNEFSPKAFFDSCRMLHGVASGGGTTASNQNKPMSTKLTEKLAKLKLISSADLSEDDAASALESSVNQIVSSRETAITERDTLKTANEKHADALKTRVTNRVTKAITDGLIKAERKDSLIAVGIQDENNIAFLDDLQKPQAAPARGARGAAPAPVVPPGDGEGELTTLRNELRNGICAADSDDVANVAIQNSRNALKARELRGHKNLFDVKFFAAGSEQKATN